MLCSPGRLRVLGTRLGLPGSGHAWALLRVRKGPVGTRRRQNQVRVNY